MQIFFDERRLLLVPPGDHFTGRVVVPGNREEIGRILHEFETDPSVQEIALSSPDYSRLKRDVKSQFAIIKAAGGLVLNEEREILFIFRRGRWDLPKGKMEYKGRGPKLSNAKSSNAGDSVKGKSKDRTMKKSHRKCEAVREVREETGLQEVGVVRKLASTYHVYYEKGERRLKKTYWFEMFASGEQKLVPQTDEDILYIKWFPQSDLPVVLENTFANLREMIRGYCHELP